MTTPLKQSAHIKTNSRDGSVCNVLAPAMKFADLWASYPSGYPYVDSKTGDPPEGFDNQCAIKASFAIHGAGVEMKSFRGAAVDVSGRKLAIRAEELSHWLGQQPFCGLPRNPENVTGENWQKSISGRTGIIFFRDYWLRDGEKSASGDHIDLWNGSSLTSGLESFIRFTIGISSFRPFHLFDLGESKEILFWEIK
jgi:hypothetical protein